MVEIVESAKNVVVTAHIRPDGDAIGSTLAFARYLEKKGKNAHVVMPNRYPDFYSWVTGIEDVVIFEEESQRATQLIKEADLLCSLDYNQMGRISAVRPIFEANRSAKRLVIDHHIGMEIEADYIMSDHTAAATCELVYRYIRDNGDENLIDLQMAENMLMGILTDTGGLSYSSNNPELYLTVAALLKYGVDKDALSIKAFHTYSESRFKLMNYALSKMEILPDGHTALIVLSRAELIKFAYSTGDLEGVVNMPLQMLKVDRSVLMREDLKKNQINVSLRSEGDVPVNVVAEHFGGGGHKNAAGFESELPMSVAVKQLCDELKKH